MVNSPERKVVHMNTLMRLLNVIVGNGGACSNCGTSKSACDLSKSGGLGACCYDCSH